MNFHNSFLNHTITCSGHKEVDLDALNLVASGACACLCPCSYSNQKGHHHFVYNVDLLTPFVHIRAGLTFEEAVALLAAGLDVLNTAQKENLVLDNLRLSKEYLFCANGGFKFVYIPIACKGYVHAKEVVLKLLALIHLKDERINRLVKAIKKGKSDSQILEILTGFVRSYGVQMWQSAAAAEGETTVLSQQILTGEEEGETTVLSQQIPVAAEGETTVLSQQLPTGEEEGTTVLSQQIPVAAEGETTVLSQQLPTGEEEGTTILSQQIPVAAEGETTVLSQQLPTGEEEGTTVLSQMGVQEDAQNTVYSVNPSENLTAFVHDASAEYETTVLTSQPQEPQRTIISGDNSNHVLYLVRNSNSEKIPVEITPFTIGKDRSNVDYALDSVSVSRQHATILYEDGVYYIVDNGSTNGTMIEGIRLQPNEKAELGNGYLISMGSESFQALLERR